MHCQSIGGPLRGAHFTPTRSSKTTYFRPQNDPLRWARRTDRECGIVDHWRSTNTCAETSRSDQFCTPEFAELTRLVLVVRKGHETLKNSFSPLHATEWLLSY